MFAEFESDPIRAQTREGTANAKVRGKLKGRQPKLSPAQERHLIALHRVGDTSVSELVELFGIGRATCTGHSTGIRSPRAPRSRCPASTTN